MSEDAALANLRRIEHIVVLMMENRSFDHMLGYLKRDGLPDVNGLDGDEWNEDDRGRRITVFPFAPDQTAFHRPGQPFDDSLDPQHGPSSVAEQLADGNGGFVKNFIREKRPPEKWRSLPMGHYTAEHLPVYDFLARNYCVCDSWHSSIPGDTWPNRLYAVAARASEPVGRKLKMLERIFFFLRWSRALKKAEKEPIFAVKAFTRHLADEQWRWYSYDPATLRLADRRYRDFRQIGSKNFAYVNRKAIRFLQRALEAPIELRDSFLDDAVKSGEHGPAPGLLDRPQLHRPPHLRADLERRPSAVRHPRRAGARARAVPRARQQSELGELAARDHLRRARRLLRPRRAAGRASRRRFRLCDVRGARARARGRAARAELRLPRVLRPHVVAEDDPAALRARSSRGDSANGAARGTGSASRRRAR